MVLLLMFGEWPVPESVCLFLTVEIMLILLWLCIRCKSSSCSHEKQSSSFNLIDRRSLYKCGLSHEYSTHRLFWRPYLHFSNSAFFQNRFIGFKQEALQHKSLSLTVVISFIKLTEEELKQRSDSRTLVQVF